MENRINRREENKMKNGKNRETGIGKIKNDKTEEVENGNERSKTIITYTRRTIEFRAKSHMQG